MVTTYNRHIMGLLSLFCLFVFACTTLANAQEKLVIIDDIPRNLGSFTVTPDGSNIIFASNDFYLFNATGQLVNRFSPPHRAVARKLFPLPDGWYISATFYSAGHVGLVRPDGTTAKTLISKGGNEKLLRSDMTEWSSPMGAAIDIERKRIFLLDVTKAEKDMPDPSWSRIAIFDFDGKYISDINRYDYKAAAGKPEKDDARRTYYSDIGVDSVRERVFFTTRTGKEMQVFSYQGKTLGAVPGTGAIAVFPDGRIAVNVERDIVIYSPELVEIARLPALSASDLEVDATGRLYASYSGNPTILFRRWAADLKTAETFHPRYNRIKVTYPPGVLTAGSILDLTVEVEGNPAPVRNDSWQVMARSSDGSELRWQRLTSTYADGKLQVTLPESRTGITQIAVRFADMGQIDRMDHANDLFVQRTVSILPSGAARSLSIFPTSGRRVYQQGEAINLALARRGGEPDTTEIVPVQLRQGDVVLATLSLTVSGLFHGQIPATLTRRLAAGSYTVAPLAEGYACYALPIDIVTALPDSPMQRIIYHEFGGDAVAGHNKLLDYGERLDFLQAYARQVAELGFTRETDRTVGKIGTQQVWNRASVPSALTAPGFAVPEYYNVPNGGRWDIEYYAEQLTRYGIVNDSQLLGHCSGVRFRDEVLHPLNGQLQRYTQWLMKYPSFYGYNYNDEAFFGCWANPWSKDDDAWLKATREAKFPGRPWQEHMMYAYDVMYGSFNNAVRRVKPDIKTTTTPMWQYPAVEGSYPPSLYKDLSESYSHYLSEGYHVPWYAPHSAEMLRRPGLPLMGVFDNQTSTRDGDIYAKNAMQVLARGVQGVGVEHTAPFTTNLSTTNIRVTNELARLYGPIFAECTPLNDAAILYSYTQDISEKRHVKGTPHWERVFEIYGAAQMAGVPMTITYEEDIQNGWLLVDRKPRVPLLLLLGQQKPLPEAVLQQIARFTQAGGKVVIDEDSADFPGAIKLPMQTNQLYSLWNAGLDTDTWHPLMQPVYEKIAGELKSGLGKYRAFPVESSDPWVAPNQFDGGTVRYLMLVSESSPYPWDAGTTWALGAMYGKGSNHYRPKQVEALLPKGTEVIYDLFNQEVVTPVVGQQGRTLTVDLTTYPARLYALAPAPLGTPGLRYNIQGDTIYYQAQVQDDKGKAMAARIPLRLRLRLGETQVQEIVRGTNSVGIFQGEFALPINAGQWTLEVTELISGQTSTATAASPPLKDLLMTERPAVEIERDDRIEMLLADAKAQGGLTLVMGRANIVNAEQQQALRTALQELQIPLQVAPLAPNVATPGIYLAAGFVKDAASQGILLTSAINTGLFDQAITANMPGAGRGLASAIFAPRAYQEDAIVLLGGDAAGLSAAITRFIDWLKTDDVTPPRAANAALTYNQPGAAAVQTTDLLKLSSQVGARLGAISVTPDGKRLLVTADGFLRNAVLLDDHGQQASVVRAERIAQSPTVRSAYLSKDGTLFGASGRVTDRYGQAMFLVNAATGVRQAFAGFGDQTKFTHQFAVSDDGNTVVTGGVYGVACWKRDGQQWKEGWTYDYYQQFSRLDWPVHKDKNRAPQFHAYIPQGADYVLVLFAETTENGWVTPDNRYGASLSAYNLADGKRRWHFEVPIENQFLNPSLITSSDGHRILLQVRIGGWGTEVFRFYTLENGQRIAEWNSPNAPRSLSVGNKTGNIACTYQDRALEMRGQDGKIRYSLLWPAQPLRVTFAADGESLFLVDDTGLITRLDNEGQIIWQRKVPSAMYLTATSERLYVSGWNGQLTALTLAGTEIWEYDLTPVLQSKDPMALVAAANAMPAGALYQIKRQSTASAQVPAGVNMLAGAIEGKYKVVDIAGKTREVTGVGNANAVIRVGGTSGWKSAGTVKVKAADLVNGIFDDVDTPWFTLNELSWNAGAARQGWAEINFVKPTDVSSITVYENPNFPDSWPTDALIEMWNEEMQRWDTAVFGTFLQGALNTYTLNLKSVTRLRYVPWNNYYRNFYTSEIEVR